jgi:hypothetical protein
LVLLRPNAGRTLVGAAQNQNDLQTTLIRTPTTPKKMSLGGEQDASTVFLTAPWNVSRGFSHDHRISETYEKSARCRELMAEEVGFEPTVRFPARRFSRPVP